MRYGRIIHSVCADFAPRKLLIVRHYTMPCAHYSKRSTCVRVKKLRMRSEDLTAICDRTKEKRSRIFNSGVSFGKLEQLAKVGNKKSAG